MTVLELLERVDADYISCDGPPVAFVINSYGDGDIELFLEDSNVPFSGITKDCEVVVNDDDSFSIQDSLDSCGKPWRFRLHKIQPVRLDGAT